MRGKARKVDDIETGHYGVIQQTPVSKFEDEGVGHALVPTLGIVVTRVQGDEVYVREWSVCAHFEGTDALEKFSEARQHYDFDFKFKEERNMTDNDCLDGQDELLKQRLLTQLKRLP